ncbi:MAG: ribosome small subunit-dependent GTPase A [Defluviitaleaceae bacterium]|nr:ribosome small subunit-dependent GTPase A [Defluviitaleaceae bacterium]
MTHLIQGQVTEHQRDVYTVSTPNGEVIASLKGSFFHGEKNFPCVGDYVLLDENNRISEILPRKTKFSRADFSGHAAGYAKTIKEQVVAANFDYVFILSSLNADFKVNRILRYITQARQSGGEPVVILTKADLVEDIITPVNAVRFSEKSVPVHVISSHTGQGMDTLREYLQSGKTIVFLGMSGVGKSSLLNALMQDEVMVVKSIREDDSRGRHTTTHRQLFTLPSGAMVIDTPGMRELGLFQAEEGISLGFQDVEELFAQCKFSNCAHKTEPGCAVRAAISDGSLSQKRWEAYQAQTRENRFVEDKAAFMRERNAQWKSSIIQYRSAKKKR